MKQIRCNLFNPRSADKADFLEDQIISLDAGKIINIQPYRESEGAWEDHRHLIALPGLIDLHVHLSQYRIRGLYQPALLPWLQKTVFPQEAKSQEPGFAAQLSRDFYNELIRKGTTYSVIYTAPYHQAAEIAFEVAAYMGIRAKIGMTLMDMNAPDEMLHSTDYALSHSIRLFEKWQNPFLGYIFTPRFAPTCSEELMRKVGEYASGHNAFIQTHLSENPQEIKWVKDIFGKSTYTEVYRDFGLLGPRSILGHAIHLSDDELKILKDHDAAIAHCPDSNFYLKSGEFPLRRIADHGLRFGIGSDVGAGTTLNMLYHAKQMNYRQSQDPVMAAEMLYRITLGSAKILDLDQRIGSLDIGKDADIVFFEPPQGFDISRQSLEQMFFMSDDFTVRRVLIEGRDRL